MSDVEKTDLDTAYGLDLDSLLDEAVKVKFKGAPEGFIEVYPPDVEDFFRLQSIQSKLQGVNPKTFTEEQVNDIMGALREVLSNSVPFVKENGLRLKMPQLLALMGYVMGLATPAEDKAMQTLGISPTEKAQGESPKAESAPAN